MNQKPLLFCGVLTVAGLALMVLGLVLIKLGTDLTLSYLCVGFGCGIFGNGVGEVIHRRTLRNSPKAAKDREIALNDERNIALRNMAAAMAYRTMVYVYGALMLAFALMGVELRAILLLAAAYLFICGCYVYYYMKYDKEM